VLSLTPGNAGVLIASISFYLWGDGIHLGAGPQDERRVLLVLIGADARGVKHLLALEEAMRESELSWIELFEDLKRRGLREPSLVIADGANGMWAAATKAFLNAQQQRCWLHKIRNVLDKVPDKHQPQVHADLRSIVHAKNETAAREQIEALAQSLQREYPKAAACVRDERRPHGHVLPLSQAGAGRAYAQRTPSNRSSLLCGSGPTQRSRCEPAPLRRIWFSNSSNVSQRTGGESTDTG
jgi:hypothetical protein